MGEGYQEEFYGCADIEIIDGPIVEPEEEKGVWYHHLRFVELFLF